MGIGRRAAGLLRRRGFDAAHLGDRGLSRLEDEKVLALAAAEGRVVVTVDADFSALLALAGATGPSVIHLRMEGLDDETAARVIEEVVRAVSDQLDAGCIVSVSSAGLRVHDLPITPGPAGGRGAPH